MLLHHQLYTAITALACFPTARVFSFQPSAHRHSGSCRYQSNSPCDNQLVRVLKQYGYDGKRLRTLKEQDLPLVAEIYTNETTSIGRAVSIQPGPLVKVQLFEDNSVHLIDIGQITTVWETDAASINHDEVHQLVAGIPDGFLESKLDFVYRSRVGRARTKGLEKRQVASIVQDFDVQLQPNIDAVMKKVLKAGKGLVRIVDSQLLCGTLFNLAGKRSLEERMKQQACAAYCLSHDAALGGRFKRWPCILVEHSSSAIDSQYQISFINGGWLVVDQSIRSGTEARKFAERSSVGSAISTTADERIIRRMECLAMGDLINRSTVDGLESDVREALKEMSLPQTPEGARDALIKIGRWTEDNASPGKTLFWPQDVLQSAAWYVKNSKLKRENASTRNVVDLTCLPCISIDAKRVAFRDDALGIRLREKTGRKLHPEASKWELLIHIVDASDIYVPGAITDDSDGHIHRLRSAAEHRGASRYDLPSGPLHLLPPTVLKELCFDEKHEFCRCVTIWAYIDERDGRLIDSGVERSIVGHVSHLDFSEATALLDRSSKLDESKEKLRALLLVIERNLVKWSEWHLRRSEVARLREERLINKEVLYDPTDYNGIRDDGSDGFVRTRGHKIVDMALDMYSYAVSRIMGRNNIPIPYATGADRSRGGRVATSPLRRFIDGQAQRQLLAGCCQIGQVMSHVECREIGKKSNEARNKVSNIRAARVNKVITTKN